jgi:hypothetical protein
MDGIDLAFTSFRRQFRTTAGRSIMGQITEAREKGTLSEFVNPRRFFRCMQSAGATPGLILHLSGGRKGLLLDNGDTSEGRFRTFKVVEITHTLAWRRRVVTVDTVTGLKKQDDSLEFQGPVDVAVEFTKHDQEQKTGVAAKYRILTGSAIQANDRLGDYQIHTVEPMLGVYLAEAS